MLLERDAQITELVARLDAVATSGGCVVLVRGEAGIGKTTLINRFAVDVADRASVVVGYCDDLLTPRPFGPLWDIARSVPALMRPLTDGDHAAVMQSTLDLLLDASRPMVMVLEDTQWADEATLDLITYLGRRIARSNGILVVSYRDVEVDADHPLRRVIGELPMSDIIRMPLLRLSAAAIEAMIGVRGARDAEAVLELTAGNPLFVSEVLASEGDAVPLSVREAVLGRAGTLSPSARRLLEFVSIVPGAADMGLVDQVIAPTMSDVAECKRHGLLTIGDHERAFPHELQRRAVESALSASMRTRLNQLALEAITAAGSPVDSASAVHHAREANDVDTIVRHAPIAAHEAIAVSSTTEAVAQFRLLEDHLERFAPDERAQILHDWAVQEAYLGNARSMVLFDRASEILRSVGDDRRLAATLTTAVPILREFGEFSRSLDQADEAIELLEPYGPTSDLARALATRSFVEFAYRDNDRSTLPLVDRALEIADLVDDDVARMHTLNIRAQALYSRGNQEGLAIMQECLRLAQQLDDRGSETRALLNISSMHADARIIDVAIDYAQRAAATAARYQLHSAEATALVLLAEFDVWAGNWEHAENQATELVGTNEYIDNIAWRLLSNIHARQGRKEARNATDRLWSLVSEDGGPTSMDPASAAVAEYLWLSGDADAGLIDELDRVLEVGIQLGTPWPSGAFAFWMWKLGRLDGAPRGTADFYGWIIRGDHRRAAGFFGERGLPYEEALALMHGDTDEQIAAVRIFDDLGAVAASTHVSRGTQRERHASPTRAIPGDETEPRRTHATSGRGVAAARTGLEQFPDRRPPVPLESNGRESCLSHSDEARRLQPDRGGRGCRRPRHGARAVSDGSRNLQIYAGGSLVIDGVMLRADLTTENGFILAIESNSAAATADRGADLVDCSGLVISPGFIDLQCNGAVGLDITTDPTSIVAVAERSPVSASPRFCRRSSPARVQRDERRSTRSRRPGTTGRRRSDSGCTSRAR